MVSMRKPRVEAQSPADPAAAHIVVAFYPYAGDTAASVSLVRGSGRGAVRLRLWSGHLPCTRADLAGLRSTDIAEVLCGGLSRLLAGYNRGALPQSTVTSRVASSASPGGPQGGDWEQPALPVDLNYTNTPRGLADV